MSTQHEVSRVEFRDIVRHATGRVSADMYGALQLLDDPQQRSMAAQAIAAAAVMLAAGEIAKAFMEATGERVSFQKAVDDVHDQIRRLIKDAGERHDERHNQ
jgi:hypothetical protein